jgi:hypothetical protein
MSFELEKLDTEYETPSEQLKVLFQQTQDSLREAINNGQGEKLFDLENQARNLSSRIFAARCSELKQTIESADMRKAELIKEIEIMREIKSSKNRQLGRAIILYEKRSLAVLRIQAGIEFLENELVSSRITMRESRAELGKLKIKKLEEINNGYQKH